MDILILRGLLHLFDSCFAMLLIPAGHVQCATTGCKVLGDLQTQTLIRSGDEAYLASQVTLQYTAFRTFCQPWDTMSMDFMGKMLYSDNAVVLFADPSE
jgi:hypothetical protein